MSTDAPLNPEDLPSQYDHEGAQARWYKFWDERGYFHAEVGATDAQGNKKPPFTIVIPPPNVTGALHLGHALNNTLQDILCRQKRMQGYNVLWMPGTDHAGIATQAVVERRLLEEEKKSRHDLGREGLVERIWEWKQQYEKRILGQLKQLGASCDWQRLRFTLDEVCARAVRETFFKLFSDGKIYRGKRLVNWDTYLQTAVSDDEVFHDPVKGHFWHFKYPFVKADLKPGEPEFVSIATTRPETMLGDTAVAVHPDPAAALDKYEAELKEKLAAAPAKERAPIEAQLKAVGDRRQSILPRLIQLRDMAQRGVRIMLPLAEREIPLIADEWAKPELGSGCVKITPAHDENDYAVWQRNLDIGAINIMNADGTLNDSVPAKYRGLSMKAARKEVVADLANSGLHDPDNDVEDREIDLAHSDRSKTPIEPYLADQWFVKMDELAQSAMDAVTDGRVKITPERYGKTYLDWLSEKRDWPVGRQLWWGHRIPIWHVTVRYSSNDQPHGDLLDDGEVKQEMSDYAESAKSNLTAALRKLGLEEGNDFTVVSMPGDRTTESTLLVCTKSRIADEAIEQLQGDLAFSDVVGKKVKNHDSLTLAYEISVPTQDEEVLDTWFSSALWPHSTLGWPEHTPELAEFYPTSVLITSRDIITLWVARMVLAGLYNMGEVPFKDVYIHPKILDGYGETMSKSKGNGVDPLDVIEKFGADALRFGLAYLTTETQDVRMPVEFECPHCEKLIEQTKKNRTQPRVECKHCGQSFSTQWAASHGTAEDQALPRGAVVSERFELGRRFCNKLWNAARFSLQNLSDYKAATGPDAMQAAVAEPLTLEDRWLLSRLATTTREVTAALAEFRYADASRALYAFAWNDFCDYYVEITKARFANPATRLAAQRVLSHVLDALVRLLHPLVPFLTEEIWQLLNEMAPLRGLTPPGSQEGLTPPGSQQQASRDREVTEAAASHGCEAAESVCIAPWPEADESHIDAEIEAQFADFQEVLAAVREIRMGQNIPPREPIRFAVRCDNATAELLDPMKPYFEQMARATLTAVGPGATAPERSASKSLGAIDVHVDVSAFFDADAEIARLEKEEQQLAKHAQTLTAKLSNENFVSRAPAEVVQQQREKLAEVEAQIVAVTAALAKLR
ncbi:MAG: valine--tRNA ligase [Planctomycetaceae bacterium]|nr:valine--tRNA ligase [Planctomycetaceae bacterium]